MKLIECHLENLDSIELNLLDWIGVLEKVNFELEEPNTQPEESKNQWTESNIELAQLLAQKEESICSKNPIIKAYKQSNVRVKATSQQRYDKLQSAIRIRNSVQDELVRVLKAKQGQDEVFQRYQAKVESDRKETRREWGGQAGGVASGLPGSLK